MSVTNISIYGILYAPNLVTSSSIGTTTTLFTATGTYAASINTVNIVGSFTIDIGTWLIIFTSYRTAGASGGTYSTSISQSNTTFDQTRTSSTYTAAGDAKAGTTGCSVITVTGSAQTWYYLSAATTPNSASINANVFATRLA
jgi:hypothetical protein